MKYSSTESVSDLSPTQDKHYIPKAEEGRLESFALGMSTFREVLLGTRSPSLARMQDIILDVIRKDRNDEHTPEKMLLRGIISMLLTLGKKRCYEELFEKRCFLLSSRAICSFVVFESLLALCVRMEPCFTLSCSPCGSWRQKGS